MLKRLLLLIIVPFFLQGSSKYQDPVAAIVDQSTGHKASKHADSRDPITDAIAGHRTQKALTDQSSAARSVVADSAKNLAGMGTSFAGPSQDIMQSAYIADPEFAEQNRRVIKLVERGIDFATKKENSIGEACRHFSHTNEFIDGELYLLLYNEDGVALSHGTEFESIWKNLWEVRDRFGVPVVQNIVGKARQGGGWVNYEWRNVPKLVYVKGFTKDNKFYAIGCGYYPHSKRSFCLNAVNGIVSMYNKMVNTEGKSDIDVWSIVNYPSGRFVNGNIEIIVLDTTGRVVVNVIEPHTVDTNILKEQDSTGRSIYKEIVNRMAQIKDLNQGEWFQFREYKTGMLRYAQRVQNANSGEIFIVTAGFFPGITEKDAVNLVRRGYALMKSSGKSTAVLEFTEKRFSDYWFGYLYLMVHDFEGNCLAHGGNESEVGKNALDYVDQDGDFYVREMITKAKELQQTGQQTGAWMNTRLRNSFASIYLMPINLGGSENFVIATVFYPSGRESIMRLLAQSAADHLRSPQITLEQTFSSFNLPFGEFSRGDLSVFAIDYTGLAYAWELTPRLIWKNLREVVDDDGKYFVKEMIDQSSGGSTTIRCKQNGHFKNAYIISVEKDGKKYIVGSSYFVDGDAKQQTASVKNGNGVQKKSVTPKPLNMQKTTTHVSPAR